MKIKIVLSLLLLGMWAAFSFVVGLWSNINIPGAAVSQFDNSDASHISSMLMMTAPKWAMTIIGLIVFLVLMWMWWSQLMKLFVMLLLAGAVLSQVPHAEAYYDKQDFTEAYFIMPNESAFFIPDNGTNRNTQGNFGSEDYLKENKIPAKRFLIPHAKLSGSGSLFADYYVPTGRLIIVDRTPYNREWVASKDRGTSAKNESFPCQSKEGMNITVGIAIGATVLEENAAKFLYRFGTKPVQGDRSRPEVIFTSVFYGRSLAEVMDGTVRSKIQTLACKEFTKRTLDQNNEQAAAVMAAIEQEVTSYAASVGITIEYIGWGDTFTFDKEVQDVINRRYVAGVEADIASKMSPHTTTLQALAAAEATRTAANKWDGKAPTTVSLWWLPASFSDALGRIFGGASK